MVAREHGRSQPFEPDFSGYVDEYRFVPLTPRLADALDDITSKLPVDANGEPDTEVTFTVRTGQTEADELYARGYLMDVNWYMDGTCSARLSSAGASYDREYRAYVARRDSWARDRQAEKRHERRFQTALVLLGVAGSLIGALIGAAIG